MSLQILLNLVKVKIIEKITISISRGVGGGGQHPSLSPPLFCLFQHFPIDKYGIGKTFSLQSRQHF